MSNDLPSAFAFGDTAIPAGCVLPHQIPGSSAAATEPQTSIASQFSSAKTFEQAYSILVEELSQRCELIAAIHVASVQHDDFRKLTVLQSSVGDQHCDQIKRLMAVCRQSADQHRHMIRRQLTPARTLFAFPLEFPTQSSQSIGLITATIANMDEFLVRATALFHNFVTWQLERQCHDAMELTVHAAAAIDLVGKVLHEHDRRDACQVIVTEITEHLNLRRMAIGIGSRRSGGCRLIAISDATRLAPTASQTRTLESVMEQALVLDDTISVDLAERVPTASGGSLEFARQQNANLVAVPLIHDDNGFRAVLLAIAEPDADLSAIQSFLHAIQPTLLTLLVAVDRSGTSRITHRLIDNIRSRSGTAIVLTILIIMGSMFVPVRHRETCKVTIEPETRRFVAAPFETTLLECDVMPGDLVRFNQQLATFDGREIALERSILQAEHDQATKKRDAAQASRAYAEQRIAELEIDGIRSELKLLDHRLGSLQLRSPIDGIVVTGDLMRAKGTPLTTGQSMFEIAPLDQMTAEVSVLDDQIAFISLEQSAELMLDAYPNRRWQTLITQINPRSEIRDQQNAFIAQCQLSNPERSLRPGMRGTIKIDCGRRRLGWILFHRPLESIAAWFWW